MTFYCEEIVFKKKLNVYRTLILKGFELFDSRLFAEFLKLNYRYLLKCIQIKLIIVFNKLLFV